MTQYSVQPGEKIFVKGYGFLSLAKTMSTNIGKNTSQHLSCKHSQKLLDHAKQSATDALKIVTQKTTEAASDLFGNKIADRITKVSKTSAQNSLEIVKNENNKEIPKEIYISPEERYKIIDDLRLI